MIVFKCNKMIGTEVNSKFFSTKRSLEKTEISIGKDGIFTRENVAAKEGKEKIRWIWGREFENFAQNKEYR